MTCQMLTKLFNCFVSRDKNKVKFIPIIEASPLLVATYIFINFIWLRNDYFCVYFQRARALRL